MTHPTLKPATELGHLMRIKAIVRPHGCFPISAATWWAGVASGRFPQPVKLGPRITAWRSEDIQKLLDHGIPTDPQGQGANHD